MEVRVLPCIQTRVGEVVSHEAHNLENGSSSLSPATRLTNGFTTIFKKYMKSFSPALNQKTFSIKKCLHLNITNKESIDINTKEDLLLASTMNEKKN